MKDYRFAADNEATYFVPPKESDELDDIGRKFGGGYDLRCHARTSGCGIG